MLVPICSEHVAGSLNNLKQETGLCCVKSDKTLTYWQFVVICLMVWTKNATDCSQHGAGQLLGGCLECPEGEEEGRGENVQFEQGRKVAQGSALPKRDIVDTTFHASCARRQKAPKRSVLPTT